MCGIIVVVARLCIRLTRGVVALALDSQVDGRVAAIPCIVLTAWLHPSPDARAQELVLGRVRKVACPTHIVVSIGGEMADVVLAGLVDSSWLSNCDAEDLGITEADRRHHLVHAPMATNLARCFLPRDSEVRVYIAKRDRTGKILGDVQVRLAPSLDYWYSLRLALVAEGFAIPNPTIAPRHSAQRDVVREAIEGLDASLRDPLSLRRSYRDTANAGKTSSPFREQPNSNMILREYYDYARRSKRGLWARGGLRTATVHLARIPKNVNPRYVVPFPTVYVLPDNCTEIKPPFSEATVAAICVVSSAVADVETIASRADKINAELVGLLRVHALSSLPDRRTISQIETSMMRRLRQESLWKGPPPSIEKVLLRYCYVPRRR